MKALITLSISLIVLFCTSCKNSDAPAYTVDITLLNQQGLNLLAPPAVYTKENIDVFYVANGKPQPHNANSNKGFFFSTDYRQSGAPWMRIDLNYDRKEKYPLTLVKFGNTKIDTIKAKFSYSRQSSPIIQAVWFNGAEKDIKGFIVIK